jgi:hypothetical protein
MLSDFFREGGWGMWPVLVFGMVTIGAAGRFAWKPELKQLGFLGAMALTTIGATFNATWTDVAAVLHYLTERAPLPDVEFRTSLVAGLMESTRPGALGGILLTLACMLLAVGALRTNRSEA